MMGGPAGQRPRTGKPQPVGADRARSLRGALDTALALLFPEPARCGLCGKHLSGYVQGVGRGRLCALCTANIEPLLTDLCAVCGRCGEGLLCGDCARTPRVIFSARAYARYTGAVEQALKKLKYEGATELLPALADWLCAGYDRHHGDDDDFVVVPVPMHPVKQRRRGFNQAEELARRLCRQRGLRRTQPLERVTLEQSQTVHVRAERLEALCSAFALVADERSRRLVRGARVLLVDDVLTTGSTADACARLLFEAGAVAVDVLTVAR